ncbi:MAG TPA: ABC transporter substrate-binding protein [Candidatus Udaeobacter sp.]|jgi:NitT/TauT family transport system substrate-binding protein|nr:ABC transporter substrate-binding protein [Candidatus Udaeobacter sp.]
MATRRMRLALFVVFFIASFGPSKESSGQSQQLTAFYTAHVVSMAPMWIAKEAGLFRKHGADVRLLFIGSGPLGTTSVLAGEVDLGIIGGFAPIRALLGGAKNLVIIGQSKTYMVGAIVGKKEITSVQDLKGKRLGIDRIGSNPDMYSQAALSRFQIDPLRDLSYIQMGSTSQGIPALKAGSVDAFTTTPPYDLFAQRLGFKVILDITALKIPFAATVLVSNRNTIARKQSEIAKFLRAYAEAVHTYLTNPEATAKIVEKYTKVEDREVLVHSMAAEAKAMEKTLQVDPKGIELILKLIGKTVPQAASAKPEDFYDSRFFNDLKDSGFLKRLWGES